MSPTLTKILLSLFWAAAGALSAWLTFASLQKQAESITPDSKTTATQLPKMMFGRLLRLIFVGVALYVALRMDALYAIVFIVALTITTWALAIAFHKQKEKDKDSTNLKHGGN